MSARERKEAGIDDLPGTLNEAIEHLKQDEIDPYSREIIS